MECPDALEFLMTDLSPEERESVTHAFYELLAGGKATYPTAMGVLLTACARQISKAPAQWQTALEEHKTVVVAMSEAAAALSTGTVRAEEIATELKANEFALKNLVKTAVSDIDVSELSRKFDAALLNSVAQSKEATAALVTAGEAATTQIARARKATLIWSIPIIFLSAAILSVSIFVWQWTELKERNNQAMIRAIQSYGEAYTVLATAGMTLQTSQTQDGSTFIYVPQAKDAYKAADYHGCVIQLK